MIHSPANERVTEEASALLVKTFAHPAEVVASAPGRVNLIGEHIDYNGGPVLPVAVERRTAVAASSAPEWALVSTVDAGQVHHDSPDRMRSGWTDYPSAVIQELGARGIDLLPARLAVASTLPMGAGLSSSAALSVATGAVLMELAGRSQDPAELADVAYHAEHDRVGVHCGRMDQTIAAFAQPGTALLFDSLTGNREFVPLPGEFWILETGVSHRLTGGGLNARRRECEAALELLQARWPALGALAEIRPAELPEVLTLLKDPVLVRRVRHVVSETERTRAAAAALQSGDPAHLGALLVEGHESLREDYESTIPEANLLVRSAVRHGAYGARLTGAGWGGAVVMLAAPARGEAVLHEVTKDFTRSFGHTPVVWSSRAAGGVQVHQIGS